MEKEEEEKESDSDIGSNEDLMQALQVVRQAFGEDLRVTLIVRKNKVCLAATQTVREFYETEPDDDGVTDYHFRGKRREGVRQARSELNYLG